MAPLELQVSLLGLLGQALLLLQARLFIGLGLGVVRHRALGDGLLGGGDALLQARQRRCLRIGLLDDGRQALGLGELFPRDFVCVCGYGLCIRCPGRSDPDPRNLATGGGCVITVGKCL